MRRLSPAGPALFLGCVSKVLANPVTVIPYFSLPVLTALGGESLAITLLLAKKGFRPLRIFISWYFITWGTLWIFELAYPPAEGIVPLVLLFGEMGIILLEAAILRFMSQRKFYRTKEADLTWKQCLLVSAAGNAVSFIVGFLWPVNSPW